MTTQEVLPLNYQSDGRFLAEFFDVNLFISIILLQFAFIMGMWHAPATASINQLISRFALQRFGFRLQ